METSEITDQRQLRDVVRILDLNIEKENVHFAFKKNGELDEYIEASEAGALTFAKELIQGVLNKDNDFATFNYDLSKDNSALWVTYIEFVKGKKSKQIPIIKINKRSLVWENVLYGVGFGISIVLIIIGAFTVAKFIGSLWF